MVPGAAHLAANYTTELTAPELVITLALAALVLATTGFGKFSVGTALNDSTRREPVPA